MRIINKFLGSSLIFFVLFTKSVTLAEVPPNLKDLNIILITVDTLSARYLGAYQSTKNENQNPERTISPNIDKLAKNSVIFKRACSPAPWTKPAIASIFTGKLPVEHKVMDLHDKLSESNQTLAEVLKANGYSTQGIVSHTFIDARQGYAQGFDQYLSAKFKGNVHKAITSDQISNQAISWLKDVSKSPAKFFIFMHYFDPHYCYHHHEKYSLSKNYQGPLKPGMDIRLLRKKSKNFTGDDVTYLKNLYREEISFTDEHIGRVVDYVRNSKLSKNTLIIFTADHGEEFMEHGKLGHTQSLHDELIQVPLIFNLPGTLKSNKIETNVLSTDIFPTLVSLLPNIPTGSSAYVKSLLPELTGNANQNNQRNLFSQVEFKSSGIEAHQVALITENHKLIYNKASKNYELFDTQADFSEKSDLFNKEKINTLDLKTSLDNFMNSQGPPTQSESQTPQKIEEDLKPEEVEQLKTLGYM